MRGIFSVVACVLLAAVAASAQTVQNPRRVIFTASEDHDQLTAYEIDIVRVSDGVVMQTISAGLPAPDGNGDVTVGLNVQPIAFGTYVVRVRAVAGTNKSVDSEPSNLWERVPGPPGKPSVGGE